MDDTSAVRIVECRGDVLRNLDALLDGELPFPIELVT